MKPKQPNFSEFYDRVSIYETTGTRTATGGYSETTSLVRTIWADVRLKSAPSQMSIDETGQRTFVKGLKVITRKDLVSAVNLLQYEGEMYFVYNLDQTNKAYDIVYAEIVQ